MTPAHGLERAAHLGLRAALPVAGFWVATALVGLADYEQGLERAVALLVAAAGLILLPHAPLPSVRARQILAVGLAVVALVLVAHRLDQVRAAVDEGRNPTVDIATTTVAAIGIHRAGGDPYTARIDGYAEALRPGGTGFEHTGGYKYGPVMTYAYLPGVVARGSAGYYLTSFAALLALAVAAGSWAGRAAGPAAGIGAAVLVLTTAFIDSELFFAGVNDVLPMALLVGAFAARAKGGGLLAGILLGLSFGAKLMPAGLLALPLLLAARTRRLELVLAAAAVSLAAYVPLLLRSPKEVIGNLVRYNLDRPGDRTGLLDGLSSGEQALVKLVVLVALIAVLAAVLRAVGTRGSSAQGHVACLVAAMVALLYAASPVLHRNWLFWIVPFFAVGIAVKAYGGPRSEIPVPPAELRAP